MRNRTTQWTAISGAALIALAMGASVPVLADANEATAGQQSHQQQFEPMQTRMQTMRALMNRIHQTTDPAARQKLMDQQFQLMRDQMNEMVAMHECVMGYGMPDHGMTGQLMMGNGVMQPGNKPEPFVHFATLLPRHLASPRKGLKVLPICPGRNEALPRSLEGQLVDSHAAFFSAGRPSGAMTGTI
jgi:hypothetical protein